MNVWPVRRARGVQVGAGTPCGGVGTSLGLRNAEAGGGRRGTSLEDSRDELGEKFVSSRV